MWRCDPAMIFQKSILSQVLMNSKSKELCEKVDFWNVMPGSQPNISVIKPTVTVLGVGFWLLAHLTHDLSQTSCHFVHLLSLLQNSFFSQLDISHVLNWPAARNQLRCRGPYFFWKNKTMGSYLRSGQIVLNNFFNHQIYWNAFPQHWFLWEVWTCFKVTKHFFANEIEMKRYFVSKLVLTCEKKLF